MSSVSALPSDICRKLEFFQQEKHPGNLFLLEKVSSISEILDLFRVVITISNVTFKIRRGIVYYISKYCFLPENHTILFVQPSPGS